MYKYFAPKRVAVERKVFEESKSYNDGMKQELNSMMIDYAKGNDASKDSICGIVSYRYSVYADKLTGDQLSFYNQCTSKLTGEIK